ncbi:flagellar hook-associated protein FlgK [Rhodobacteraceae bacterium RKSG542]|uniref:flagellar hook-associated protein FlgK n=1 Tax=Pseudovibrio flavus TaxID=2529854 RepID=UPI0012BBDABE|nr:flagellar hook-associated protein FlgK [Pseudovibrio flavus]MTI19259.1 flagellar hook-associated protein FlgK [Pseudovibrio flavus]
MGLSSALGAAISGINLVNRQMDVAAGNITNADTKGYSLKSVTSVAVVNGDTGATSVRSGAVERDINTMLRSAYWQNLSQAGHSAVMADYTSRLDQLFGQIDDPTSLPSLMNDLTGSLRDLAADPSSLAAQSTVISHSQALAYELNSASRAVQDMRKDADQQAVLQVDALNTLMQDIEAQEDRILQARHSGQSTANLEDQMDLLLEDLTGFMDVNIVTASDGGLRISTLSGQTIYDDKASSFALDRTSGFMPGSEGAAISVTSPSGQKSELNSYDLSSGSIGALMTLRDETLPQAQRQLDEIASQMAMALSRQTTGGVAVDDGLVPPLQTGLAVDISLLQSAGDRIELEFVDSRGETRQYSFIAVDDPSLLPLDSSLTANPNDVVVGLDMSAGAAAMDAQIQQALGSSFAVSTNGSGDLQVLANAGGSGVSLSKLNVVSSMTSVNDAGNGLPVFVDGRNGGQPITGYLENGGQLTGLSASITVNNDLIMDPSILSGTGAGGAVEQSSMRAEQLLASLTSETMYFSSSVGIGTERAPLSGTVAEFAGELVAAQGQQSARASELDESAQATLALSQKNYEDSYAVDVDAQLVFLMELENSYAANARVLDAINQMLDDLMRVV